MNPLNIFKNLPFYLRKKISDKYILIESDDWGLERAVSSETIDWMKKKYGEDKFSRWTLDTLETTEDLEILFDVIDRYKNKFEYPPVITANFITHNIDYTKSENLNYEGLNSKITNNKYPGLKELYIKGIKSGYIFPQLHGYSHFDLTLMDKYFETEEGKEAFGKKFFTCRSTIKGNLSFLHGEMSHSNFQTNRFEEACSEFEKFFGFISKSVIPPTFIFDKEFEKILIENKITLLQSSNRLLSTNKKRYRYPYFRIKNGLIRSVRNARLDPHPEYKFYYKQCIESIDKAFKIRNPAVIDFHRVNFSGKFAPKYRDRTISELKNLFDEIYVRWPEAKFIHTQKLNELLWQH
ncbi:MAG: hypothetical protein IPL16_11140 [Ignavibacteria bacterium]|nr:hypothetical protein [Ignavibacteria bacterium]